MTQLEAMYELLSEAISPFETAVKAAKEALKKAEPIPGDSEETALIFVYALRRAPKVASYFKSVKDSDTKYRLEDMVNVVLRGWLKDNDDEEDEDEVRNEVMTFVPSFKAKALEKFIRPYRPKSRKVEWRNHVVESKTPTVPEIEEWWDYMSPGSIKSLKKELKLSTASREKWNARDWEKVMDYYVQIELGDPRGYSRGRNV